MGLFKIKSKSQPCDIVNPAVEAMNLLLADKIDQMASIDTLITLLIQRHVFTKKDFDCVKSVIKDTDRYKKLYEMVDQLTDALNPDLARTRLTDEEIEELAKYFSNNGDFDEKGKVNT